MPYLLALIAVALLLVTAAPAAAVSQVEVRGLVVGVQGTRLTLDVDSALLTLDASEVDPRFLQALQPGDDVRVTAFRLDDGSLLVYNVFVQPDDDHETAPSPGPQGGTD